MTLTAIRTCDSCSNRIPSGKDSEIEIRVKSHRTNRITRILYDLCDTCFEKATFTARYVLEHDGEGKS